LCRVGLDVAKQAEYSGRPTRKKATDTPESAIPDSAGTNETEFHSAVNPGTAEANVEIYFNSSVLSQLPLLLISILLSFAQVDS
jgi:hypothetical protein